MARYSRYRSSYQPRSLRRKASRTQKNLVRNVIIGIILIYVVVFWGLPNLIGSLSFLNKFKTTQSSDNPTEDVTLAPPVLNIPYEATNSARIRISGYATAKTQVKIYFDDALMTTTNAQDDGSFQSDPIPLSLGTNNIYGKDIDSSGKESLPSKTIQLIYNNDQPKLSLVGPNDNTQIHGGDKKVEVSGDTDPNDSITVNGTTVIVNQDNHFDTYVSLNDGDNTITVVATNSVGNTTTISRKVTYSQ